VSDVNVYTQNKLEIFEMETDHFGKLLVILIGATMVDNNKQYIHIHTYMLINNIIIIICLFHLVFYIFTYCIGWHNNNQASFRCSFQEGHNTWIFHIVRQTLMHTFHIVSQNVADHVTRVSLLIPYLTLLLCHCVLYYYLFVVVVQLFYYYLRIIVSYLMRILLRIVDEI
jgi:hypothetical protein